MAAAPDPPRTDRNVGFEEESIPLSQDSSTASRQKWISRANRNRTDLENPHIESRAFRHAYIVKRPQALHYKRIDDPNNDYPLLERKLTRPASNSSGSGGDREERSTDDILKQISRLDLFGRSILLGNISFPFPNGIRVWDRDSLPKCAPAPPITSLILDIFLKEVVLTRLNKKSRFSVGGYCRQPVRNFQ